MGIYEYVNKIRPNCYEILLWSFDSVDSVDGIATCYGLDGLWIESRSGRDFSHLSRPILGAHTASCQMGTGSLFRG
jgi:hypothetical protein